MHASEGSATRSLTDGESEQIPVERHRPARIDSRSRLLAIGLPIGIAGAYAVGRLLQSILIRTNASDPVTLAVITLIMIVVSVAACFWPARKATRLDPVMALRYE